jgi:AcrR family transcriptional regulator
MTTTAPKTKRISAPERRVVIIRAAGPLFARYGYVGARLEDIATAAGVTKPILYRHFDSKKALYLALLEKHQRDLPSFFEGLDGAPADGSPDTLVRLVLDHWLDYVRENQHAWVMLFRDSSGDEEIRDIRRQVSARAREVMVVIVSALPGSPIPAAQIEPTAELLRSGLAGLALWWIDHPDVPKPVVVDVAARISVAAVGLAP